MTTRIKSWSEAREAAVSSACPECWTLQHDRFIAWHMLTEHGVALPADMTIDQAKPKSTILYQDELVVIGEVGDTYGD
jgi:hypothetical protein